MAPFVTQEEPLKRKDAFRKLRTICQRLDEVNPKRFEVEPRRLYLFGSVLTDKPHPNNLGLLLLYMKVVKNGIPLLVFSL